MPRLPSAPSLSEICYTSIVTNIDSFWYKAYEISRYSERADDRPFDNLRKLHWNYLLSLTLENICQPHILSIGRYQPWQDTVLSHTHVEYITRLSVAQVPIEYQLGLWLCASGTKHYKALCINPYDAGGQYKIMQQTLKITEILAHRYSSESYNCHWNYCHFSFKHFPNFTFACKISSKYSGCFEHEWINYSQVNIHTSRGVLHTLWYSSL